MAKQEKETFNDMLRQLQATKVTASQPVDVFEERKYFLIVCEGKRTEPIYFEYFKKFLPKNLLETIEIKGKGDNTINIVKAAIKERDDRKTNALLPAFDEVWAVFDKDDFPPKNFNRAIELALQQEVECGHSNESFELWYVLHFQFLNTALKRQAYVEILTNALGFKYKRTAGR